MLYMASRTIANSSGFKLENIKAYSSLFFKASRTYGVLGYLGALNSPFLFQLPKTSALTEALGPFFIGYFGNARS